MPHRHKEDHSCVSHADIAKQAQEKAMELDKMAQYIITILDNAHVASNCFEYPVLIKEKTGHENLYLGYAVNADKFKALCFFESRTNEQFNHKLRNVTISKRNASTAVYRIRDIFGIKSVEELQKLVTDAL